MSQSKTRQVGLAATPDPGWRSLYRLGGIAALLAILLPPLEVVISLLPGVERATTHAVTAVDWFTLFYNNWFLGLRHLGLLNLVGAALLCPTILAVYCALRGENKGYALFATVIFFLGTAVYFANNRGFVMLSLSREYAAAATDNQRALLAAAGQAILAEGRNRAGLPLIEFACFAISAVMLRGRAFGQATAFAGMLGNLLLMIVEIILTFKATLTPEGMGVAAVGGLSIMTWYFLMGRKLLQLSALPNGADESGA